MSYGQTDTRAWLFSGIVYDNNFNPLPYTHVIAKGTGKGDITDINGVFSLYVREFDMLSIYNLAYKDTTILIYKNNPDFFIKLKKKAYPIHEAKIFQWGSSYGEFIDEVKRQGIETSFGYKLGLPVQNPDYVPVELDDNKVKKLGFLVKSPVSFFYYNFNKHAKSARKVYNLEKESDRIKHFEELVGAENLSGITGLSGLELEKFMVYLNEKMSSSYKSAEIDIIMEIHALWENYSEVQED